MVNMCKTSRPTLDQGELLHIHTIDLQDITPDPGSTREIQQIFQYLTNEEC